MRPAVPDETAIEAPKKKKKRATAASVRDDLAKMQGEAPERPPPNLNKIFIRVGAVLVVIWISALFIPSWIAKAVAGGVTLIAIGAAFWITRYVKKAQALGDLLKGATTADARKEAIEKLQRDFKKGDTQAILARAQLEMQEDPRKALATLESVNLEKEMTPIADQVRTLRATLHLTLGEPQEARALVDRLELGKAQDAKTRALFATVAAEAWARTGQAKKAMETLELFNPEDPEFAEARLQMWRARAFAAAALNDTKAIGRALKRIADTNPQLLAMFIGTKKVHPLLEREAKQMLMRSGAVPRKVVRQRV